MLAFQKIGHCHGVKSELDGLWSENVWQILCSQNCSNCWTAHEKEEGPDNLQSIISVWPTEKKL